MSQLTLVCPSYRGAASSATQWAHDMRNTLTTVGLHLDTLERLAGSSGREAVEAAHALIRRATVMCEQALGHASRAEPLARRRPVDVVAAVRQVAELLAPVAPEAFDIRIRSNRSIAVMADPEHLFRVVFNLLHNAVTVARRHGTLKTVNVWAERSGATVVVRIADDGPGLPAQVRKHLFRPDVSATGGHGFGLSIARELAEKNGGTLALARSAKGTAFVLELPVPSAAVAALEGPVTRSLGGRAA
jgi:signal transduction histidine kinase